MKINKWYISIVMVLFLRIVVIVYKMPLSYSIEIQEVETRTNSVCVSKDYSPTSGQFYRFTFENINHPDNFKPVALLRQIPTLRCNHWSLSLYNTEEKAIEAFASMFEKQKKKKGNLNKSFGDYLAVGEIQLDDGFKGPDRIDGHFEYFTNDSFDFRKFEILKKLA